MPEDTNPTTPAEGVTEDQTATPEVDVAALQAKYERAQADIKKYRTRADEVEASKKLIEQETLKQRTLEEQITALTEQAAKAEERAVTAEKARVTAQHIAAATGKVADPQKALRLAEEKHFDDDGVFLVDAFLADNPFMTIKIAGPTPTVGAGGSNPSATAVKRSELQGRLEKARTRQERISLDRQIRELKG